MIERKKHKLQIIVLNTNLMMGDEYDSDAQKQWTWLSNVLNKTLHSKQTVCKILKNFIIYLLRIILALSFLYAEYI